MKEIKSIIVKTLIIG